CARASTVVRAMDYW
nr:immunoglobulin heavy chain junction region [Mus musculus]